ncbi:MAG: hypothetical protein QOI29_581 [Mycobacterium sp.]|nr:hypothetical protein [Mycobacterium sp.]
MTVSVDDARYTAPNSTAAEGWRLERLTAPSRLFGANGLRTGPDGRVYVAQVTGSQISALDLGTGLVDTVSAKGGDIIAPDDVAFDSSGNLYATEVMDGRVSVRDAGGRTRVLRDDLPCANGVTVHQDRLFIGECRGGGRLMELDRGTGAQRILLEDLPSPNAMEVGPDGLLYYPLMTANEIWRVDPDPDKHGEPQRVAGDLGVPDAVKFDSEGFIVSTQVAREEVLRFDPRTGEQTLLAQLSPGLDNLTFVGDRLFVSNFTGEITEILRGRETRTVLPGGLNWPLDLAIGDDGNLYVADGTYFYVVDPDGSLQTVGMLFSPGYPGFLRGLAPAGPGTFVVATSGGQIARYRPGDGEQTISQTDSTSSMAWRSARVTPSCSPNSAPVGCTRCGRATQRCWLRDCRIRSASRSTRTAARWWPNPAPVGWSDSPARRRRWSTACNGHKGFSWPTERSTSSMPAPRR